MSVLEIHMTSYVPSVADITTSPRSIASISSTALATCLAALQKNTSSCKDKALLSYIHPSFGAWAGPELQSNISQEVRWQLMHAVLGSPKFGFTHLNAKDLVALYHILCSYHAQSQNKEFISTYITAIDCYLHELCWTSVNYAKTCLQEMRLLSGPLLEQNIEKMEFFISCEAKCPFPTYPQKLLKLVELQKKPAAAEKYFQEMTAKQLHATWLELETFYEQFIVWLEKCSLLSHEPSPTADKPTHLQKTLQQVFLHLVQKIVMLLNMLVKWLIVRIDILHKQPSPKPPIASFQADILHTKSQLAHRVYEQYLFLLKTIIQVHPKLFHNTLGIEQSSSSSKFQISILHQGMQTFAGLLKKQHEIKESIIICANYEDYVVNLQKIAHTEGEWFFIIQCSENGVQNIHQGLVYLSRKIIASTTEELVLVLDGNNFQMNSALEKLTKKILPFLSNHAKVFVPLSCRQADNHSCSSFVLNDMEAISSDKESIMTEIQGTAIQIDSKGDKIPKTVDERILGISSFPLKLLQGVQSLARIEAELQETSIQENALQRFAKFSMQNLALQKKFIAHFHDLKNTYTLEEPTLANKATYARTKFHGLSTRLKIARYTLGILEKASLPTATIS